MENLTSIIHVYTYPHTQPSKRCTFSLRLLYQTVPQSLANSLQLLHQTMKRNSPFSLQLSRRTKRYGCRFYCFIMQQATIPLSTSLTSSSRVYFHLCTHVCAFSFLSNCLEILLYSFFIYKSCLCFIIQFHFCTFNQRFYSISPVKIGT